MHTGLKSRINGISVLECTLVRPGASGVPFPAKAKLGLLITNDQTPLPVVAGTADPPARWPPEVLQKADELFKAMERHVVKNSTLFTLPDVSEEVEPSYDPIIQWGEGED